MQQIALALGSASFFHADLATQCQVQFHQISDWSEEREECVCVVPVDSREERGRKEVPVAACCCVLFVSRQILNRWLCWFTKTVCWLADKREGLQRFSLPFTARCSLYRCCCWLLMGGRNRNFVCWKVEMQFNWKWYRLKPNKTLQNYSLISSSNIPNSMAAGNDASNWISLLNFACFSHPNWYQITELSN